MHFLSENAEAAAAQRKIRLDLNEALNEHAQAETARLQDQAGNMAPPTAAEMENLRGLFYSVTIEVCRLAEMIDQICEESETVADMIREAAADDDALAEILRMRTSLCMERGYAVEITVPVHITVGVKARDEDDAHEAAMRELENAVDVRVGGADEYDWSTDEAEIDSVNPF